MPQPTKKPTKAKLSDAVTTQPKSTFYAEWAERKEIFCDTLGMTLSQLEEIHIESIRCKGNDFKERRFMRRIMRTETLFQDEGYYLEFFTASAPTVALLATIGPFDDKEHSEDTYDFLVKYFKFHEDLLINKPEALDAFDDLFADEDDLFDFEDDEDEEFEGLFEDEEDDDDLWG